MPLQRCLSSDSMTSMVYSTRAVKIPAASGGALEGRSLSCWGNLSPKPPNKDAIPPHRKQWGILASFRDGSQVLDLQRDALLEVGVAPGRVYEDLASGHKDDRPGLASCLKALQPGNTLVVWSLDRLGRDLKHLVGLVDTLHQREVGLKVLAGAGAQIDT